MAICLATYSYSTLRKLVEDNSLMWMTVKFNSVIIKKGGGGRKRERKNETANKQLV